MPPPQPNPTRARGFTLIELVMVIALIAVLSATTIPAIARIPALFDTTLAHEIERRLLIARTHATTTGIPTALRVDLEHQRATFLILTPTGIQPRPAGLTPSTVTHADSHADSLAAIGPARLTNIHIDPTNNQPNNQPNNQQNPSTRADLWFDHLGTPHQRNTDGQHAGDLTSPAWFQTQRGLRVTVQPSTAHIHIQPPADNP